MFKRSALTLAVLAAMTGCGSDSSSSDNSGDPITMSFKVSASNSADQIEYLIQQEDLKTDAISAQGAGYEQTSWNFYYAVGDTLFISGYGNKEMNAYQANDGGDLEKINTFLFDETPEVFGHIGSETLLATDQPRSGAHVPSVLYTLDAQTGQATAKTSYTIHHKDTGVRGEGTVAAASGLAVEGDKLFVAFHKWDDSAGGTNYRTDEQDTAFVAVYDYPLTDNAEPLKIISDERTGHIGVNGNPTNMIRLENGDIYTMSHGGVGAIAAGFSSNSETPSGILRINSGETEFDADYFLNISEKTDGGRIFWFSSIGGNKVLARILTANEAADQVSWSAFGKDFHTMKLVLIDLEEQTVTDVEGVPMHQKRWTSPLEVIDGKVYLSIETPDGAHVYEYDVATNVATKGAKIVGKTIKGFYDL
ncbi:hypothetical protein GCM10011297_20210 [Bacterioplanes sanyensis]|uniref:DUF4374 domain-containing protein n=1 Tax=Bacterioplanes sanyensis TaxID=1249553 RepID=UPI00167AAD29|nr:DUF4374 domain-containing protein [Bacterioplanes sanyensis]GGY47414.1 hypothetical protein GCM10011297_20210 [Bacterioplanes sanyensis]